MVSDDVESHGQVGMFPEQRTTRNLTFSIEDTQYGVDMACLHGQALSAEAVSGWVGLTQGPIFS